MRSARSWLVLAALAAAACSSDSPTAPGSSAPVDINTLLSQLAGGGLSGGAATATTGGVLPATTAVTPSAAGCAYSPSVQGFVCPATTRNGLTLSMTYYLFDAAGHSQAQLDPATTASIRSVTDVSGTINASTDTLSGTISLTSHTDMTMIGLLEDLRHMSGTTLAHYDMNLTKPEVMHMVSDVKSTTTSLALPARPDPARPWPTAGTVATDMTSTGTIAGVPIAAATVHTVLTFTGANIVTMTMSIGGISTTTCRVDLTGKTATVCS